MQPRPKYYKAEEFSEDEVLTDLPAPSEPAPPGSFKQYVNMGGTIAVVLVVCLTAGTIGWFSHAALRPDYADLVGTLKDKGLTILAQTIDESSDICFVSPMKKRRSCDLLWSAPDLQAKAEEGESSVEKVAQANVRVPQ